jgi:CHRD domain
VGAGDFHELQEALMNDTAYANVHSTKFATGELRGQIVKNVLLPPRVVTPPPVLAACRVVPTSRTQRDLATISRSLSDCALSDFSRNPRNPVTYQILIAALNLWTVGQWDFCPCIKHAYVAHLCHYTPSLLRIVQVRDCLPFAHVANDLKKVAGTVNK